MRQNQPIFLDTGIFIAFLNGRDRWHTEAVQLFGQSRLRWRTSYAIVSELYSWFLHRMGEESARTGLRFLAELEGLQIFGLDGDHHQAVLRMLGRLRGSKLTYADASSLCFIERHGINVVWSTDMHLSLNGAQVLPRI